MTAATRSKGPARHGSLPHGRRVRLRPAGVSSAAGYADNKEFADWKQKNGGWINRKGRRTGIVYVVRPKPGQENFIKVGSTNEVWDRFQNRYKEYLPAGYEIHAIAQYAGSSNQEKEDITTSRTIRRLVEKAGGRSESEVTASVDEMSKEHGRTAAEKAEKAIHRKLRQTLGGASFKDERRGGVWRDVKEKQGEWFDAKNTGNPSKPGQKGDGTRTVDMPEHKPNDVCPKEMTVREGDYMPHIVQMVKCQGRLDGGAMKEKQMRWFTGKDIAAGKTAPLSWFQRQPKAPRTRGEADATEEERTEAVIGGDSDQFVRGHNVGPRHANKFRQQNRVARMSLLPDAYKDKPDPVDREARPPTVPRKPGGEGVSAGTRVEVRFPKSQGFGLFKGTVTHVTDGESEYTVDDGSGPKRTRLQKGWFVIRYDDGTTLQHNLPATKKGKTKAANGWRIVP